MLLFSIFFLFGPEIPTARIDRIGTGKTGNRKYRVFLKLNIEIFPVLNISTQHYIRAMILFQQDAPIYKQVILQQNTKNPASWPLLKVRGKPMISFVATKWTPHSSVLVKVLWLVGVVAPRSVDNRVPQLPQT